MPSGVPNVDAPENYWAGEYDAQQYADALGMSWIAPLFALNQPRVVNIATLCAAPKPSAPEFTTTDLATGLIPGAGRDAATAKLQTFTDAYLWTTYCTPADDPPPPPDPPQPPPADLPTNPYPVSGETGLLHDIWRWTEWMRRELLPRTYYSGSVINASGSGQSNIPSQTSDDLTVFAAGIRFSISARPDYLGRSNGGDFPVFYDAGWISMGTSGGADIPIRVNYDDQVIYGHIGQVTRVYWNLPPNVELLIWPLYPITVASHE